MSNSAKLNDTGTQSPEILPNISNLADDHSASGSNDGNLENLEDPLRRGSGAKTTGFRSALFNGPPHRMDTVRSAEMEEDQAGENEMHELTDLSPIALYRRIAALEHKSQRNAALEQTQELLQQHIATLEANMLPDSVGQKQHTAITPWRLLDSALILGLGGYKTLTTYQGQTTGPTTADWIVGVVWALISYWVSFFEDPTASHSSWFFSADLCEIVFSVVVNLAIWGFIAGGGVIAFAILHAALNIWGGFFEHPTLTFIVCSPIAGAIGWYASEMRGIAQRTLRSLLSRQHFLHFFNAAFLHFSNGLFHGSDWSIRNPVGRLFMGLISLTWALLGIGAFCSIAQELYSTVYSKCTNFRTPCRRTILVHPFWPG
ncbi:hypothetical protein MVEN_01144100 [Mycena venus]|uniref:Uncharacterized protein n=1 Tax=Mycena venus TaxID=2733690 RepID=A0A8H6Y531_9AGAR|nr:hypothetical protein MVEN_01144100 [Mycena venus]